MILDRIMKQIFILIIRRDWCFVAAKIAYKIPDSLKKSYGDIPIVISTRKGTSLRPLPVKVVGGFVGGGLFIMWLIQSTFMKPSPIYLKGILIVLLIALLSMLLMPDRTGKSRYSLVPALFNYMQASSRSMIVRRNKPANNFMHVSGIHNVFPSRGLIQFTDGTLGYAYQVVGNASVLLFDEDKDAILSRVDNFYRKMKSDYQIIYLTAKEPQHVKEQLANMQVRFQNAAYKDPDLRAIARMEYRIVHDDVGTAFRSTHQYMIIKADNPEALTLGQQMLRAECEDPGHYMFKEADALVDDDLLDMLGSVFKGRESI